MSPRPHASCGCRAASTLPICTTPPSRLPATEAIGPRQASPYFRSGSIVPSNQRNEDELAQSQPSRQLAPSLLDEPKGHGSRTDYILLMGDDPTLYEWAGGRDAFDRLIDAFYDRVEQDELLSPLFPGGVHEEHRRNVATWWSEVFGGPTDYTDRIGGYERMLRRHLQLDITNDQRFRFVSLMSLAADDAKLPSDPEFRSALVAYLEWGTRLALGNSQTGAEVVEQAPVPRWGWGEAPPY
jgi:hemoglobin